MTRDEYFHLVRRRLAPRLSSLVTLWALACGGGVPYGKVDFGTFGAQGVVDIGYLENQLGQLEPRFQACYARALARNRTSQGRIRLVIIGGNKRLEPRVTGNTTGDSVLTECVTRMIGELPIVERDGPWTFTADWDLGFEIVEPPKRRETGKGKGEM